MTCSSDSRKSRITHGVLTHTRDHRSFSRIFDAATILKAGAALNSALAAASPTHPGDDPGPATRVTKSSLSLYFVLIHRFGELQVCALHCTCIHLMQICTVRVSADMATDLQHAAKTSSIPWPFQQTNAEAFEAFSRMWNATGVVPGSLGEGDTRSLKDLRDENLQVRHLFV